MARCVQLTQDIMAIQSSHRGVALLTPEHFGVDESWDILSLELPYARKRPAAHVKIKAVPEPAREIAASVTAANHNVNVERTLRSFVNPCDRVQYEHVCTSWDIPEPGYDGI